VFPVNGYAVIGIVAPHHRGQMGVLVRDDLRSIARAHLEKARSGDMAAIKELADRLDGKPAQDSSVAIEHRRPEEFAAGGLATAPSDSEDVH
jgi:hypothetical protein